MEIRKATTSNDIARAAAIDKSVIGSGQRADYIASVAESSDLSVAILQAEIQAFCCLDHDYFFGRPFISLLVVSPYSRRLGLGSDLLSHNAKAFPEVWTSTNRSNAAMRALLEKEAWSFCGELSGLDEGDPEQFFKSIPKVG